MNRYNDWENLLSYANEELKEFGYQIRLSCKDGFYNCNIYKGKKKVETYAENYYEDELSELINDAWHYVNITYKPKK